MSDEEIVALLTKEAKKRQESADLYKQGGNDEKAEAELAEKRIIEGYLPKQLTDDELIDLIDIVIKELGASGTTAMGQVIGVVKQRAVGQADGARIAQLVKQQLEG